MVFETLSVREEGAVLFATIAAPPMKLLGPELVRDLVSLIPATSYPEDYDAELAERYGPMITRAAA